MVEKVNTMEQEQSGQISEQEAQLYDRQIRLWGLDAQKRLRAAKICLIGMRGLGCEVYIFLSIYLLLSVFLQKYMIQLTIA